MFKIYIFKRGFLRMNKKSLWQLYQEYKKKYNDLIEWIDIHFFSNTEMKLEDYDKIREKVDNDNE